MVPTRREKDLKETKVKHFTETHTDEQFEI